jgi:hypothetical protein
MRRKAGDAYTLCLRGAGPSTCSFIVKCRRALGLVTFLLIMRHYRLARSVCALIVVSST